MTRRSLYNDFTVDKEPRWAYNTASAAENMSQNNLMPSERRSKILDDFDAEAKENCKDLACARIYCSSPEGLKQLYPLAKETILNPISRLSHTSNEVESMTMSIAPGVDDHLGNKSN